MARAFAVLLFLLPSLCIMGYVATEAHRSRTEMLASMTLANELGLAGLVITAAIEIYLPRFYEGV